MSSLITFLFEHFFDLLTFLCFSLLILIFFLPIFPRFSEVLFSFIFAIFIFSLPFLKIQRSKIIFLFLFFFTLFLTWIFLSIFWSKFPLVSINGFLEILFFFFPAFFFILSLKFPEKFLLKEIKFLSFLGFLLSLYAIIFLFFGEFEERPGYFLGKVHFLNFNLTQKLIPISLNSFCLTSVFPNPNPFGFFLSLSLTATFFLFFSSKSLFYFFSFLFQFLILLFTFSRGGILSFFFSLITFYFLLRKRKIKIKHLLFPILIFSATFLFFLFLIFNFKPYLNKISLGINKRTEIWMMALKLFFANPIFGIGFRAFPYLLEKMSGEFLIPHNTFLGILSELGIFGFLFFLGFYFLPLFEGIKKILSREEQNFPLLAIALVFWLSFFIQDFFENRIFYYSLPIFTFLWLSFSAILLHPKFGKL